MKKKLIFFLTRYPYPALGGDKKRVVSLINFYKKKYKIYLCIISFDKVKIVRPNEFHYKLSKIFQTYKSIIEFINSKLPYQCSLYFNDEILKKIKKDFKKLNFDLAIFHLLRSTTYTKTINTKKIYLDATDSQILNYSRLIKKFKKIILVKKFFLKEKKLLKNFYKNINEKFNKIFYINNYDILYDKKIIKNKNLTLLNNNYSDLPLKNYHSPSSNNLLFLGRLTSIANLSGILELILFFKENNKLSSNKYNIYICGYSNFIFKIIYFFIKNKNIFYIPSYEELLKKKIKFQYGLAYLAISSGFQNKVLDYQMLQLPVITSSGVINGLPRLLKKNCIHIKNIKNLCNFFFSKKINKIYFNKKYIKNYLKLKDNE